MRVPKYYAFLTLGLVLLALAMVSPTKKASAEGDESQFIVASSMLSDLAPGAVYPFIDTTPRTIFPSAYRHYDATTNCSPGAASPSNVNVLAGKLGCLVVSVMGASTNTGIRPHWTVRLSRDLHAGQGGSSQHRDRHCRFECWLIAAYWCELLLQRHDSSRR